MQTFVPEFTYYDSLMALDNQRLGKQRLECKQIYTALVTGKGWIHHPATKMWIGKEHSLLEYAETCCNIWRARAMQDSLQPYFATELARLEMANPRCDRSRPAWATFQPFVLSHRSNLIRKRADLYADRWPDTPRNLPYLWPAVQNDGHYRYYISKSEWADIRRGKPNFWWSNSHFDPKTLEVVFDGAA